MQKEISLILILVFTTLFLFTITGTLRAADDDVDFDIELNNKLIVDYHKDKLFINLTYGDRNLELETACNDVGVYSDQITLTDELVLTPEGIEFYDKVIPYNLLKRRDLETISRGHIVLDFTIREKPSKSRVPSTIHNAFQPLTIEAERFIRGDVLNFGSDVEIYGEVSRNVICFFGDITLHPKAVVRGDVIAICGRVIRAEDSQIYGQVISRKGHQKGGRKYAVGSGLHELELAMTMDYNRVDGFHPELLLKYDDPNYYFPNLEIGYSYAFELKRSRYHVDLSQRIFNEYALEPYVSVYRETASEDDWIVTKNENIPYALLVNEDLRDYYEREGALAGIKFYLGNDHSFDFEYRYDKLDDLEAHPLLWSLFNAKEFRSNFSTLPYDLKQQYSSDFTSKLSQLKMSYHLDTRISKYSHRKGWIGHAYYETAGGKLGGDLEFQRWWFQLTRLQPLNKYLGLNLRVIYAGSNQRLPLFKQYFLGGLNTLRGYKHKEFFGEQMFMANAEYSVEFGHNLSGALFFDIGNVVGQDEDIFRDGEFKSDIGLAVEIDPGIRLEVARSLDSSDPDYKVWVTFSGPF